MSQYCMYLMWLWGNANIERVKFTKLLGLYLSDTLGAGKQIEYMLNIWNQWLYLLNQLKKRGLSKQKLNTVFNAVVMCWLTYAAAAWRGYASSAECNNFQAFLIKAKRWGLISEDINFYDILSVHESKLFKKTQYRSHCLSHLFPLVRHSSHAMVLRDRGHQGDLSHCDTITARKSFVNRMLFKYK